MRTLETPIDAAWLHRQLCAMADLPLYARDNCGLTEARADEAAERISTAGVEFSETLVGDGRLEVLEAKRLAALSHIVEASQH